MYTILISSSIWKYIWRISNPQKTFPPHTLSQTKHTNSRKTIPQGKILKNWISNIDHENSQTLSNICRTLSNIVEHCRTFVEYCRNLANRHCRTLSNIVEHLSNIVEIWLIDIVEHCRTLSNIVEHCRTWSNKVRHCRPTMSSSILGSTQMVSKRRLKGVIFDIDRPNFCGLFENNILCKMRRKDGSQMSWWKYTL